MRVVLCLMLISLSCVANADGRLGFRWESSGQFLAHAEVISGSMDWPDGGLESTTGAEVIWRSGEPFLITPYQAVIVYSGRSWFRVEAAVPIQLLGFKPGFNFSISGGTAWKSTQKN